MLKGRQKLDVSRKWDPSLSFNIDHLLGFVKQLHVFTIYTPCLAKNVTNLSSLNRILTSSHRSKVGLVLCIMGA